MCVKCAVCVKCTVCVCVKCTVCVCVCQVCRVCRCGPCIAIAPKFVQLSDKYPDVVFLKLNVDICHVSGYNYSDIILYNYLHPLQNTAKRYEVSATPTFVFFRNREKLNLVRSYNYVTYSVMITFEE